MKTPNQEAADRIRVAIREKKLLGESGLKSLGGTLEAGTVKDTDWVVLVKADAKEGAQHEQDKPAKDHADVD
jgi:hypothetical protein